MTTPRAMTPPVAAAGSGRQPGGARRNRRARYLRIAAGVAVFLLVDGVAYVAGQALHPHRATRAVRCPLQAAAASSGRASISYADDTNDPQMSDAIRAAVAAWNAAPTDVTLQPTQAAAALTFRAAAMTKALPACRSAAARSVVVTLSTKRWNTPGAPAVRQPEAQIAKVIGHALGLPFGGRCPALMAARDCTIRDPGPNPAEIAMVNRLYRAAS